MKGSIINLLIFIFVIINNNIDSVFSDTPDVQTKIACQYDTLNLNCKKNKILQIVSANYGRTDVAICGLGGDTNCYTASTYDIVKDLCDSSQSCSVSATEKVFGEPCLNTIKYLEVSFICIDNKM